MIDGEGYINVRRYRGGTPYAQVCVTGTNEDLAESLQESFGGNVTWKTAREKPTWKPEFTWRVAHAQAVALLSRVARFLVVKWPQARLALSLDAIKKITKEDGQLVSRGYRKGWAYPEGTVEAFDFICESMRQFNARGLGQPDPWQLVEETANAS